MASLPDKLDLALVKRLREVVGGAPAIESELRALADQAGGWARATEILVVGQISRWVCPPSISTTGRLTWKS